MPQTPRSPIHGRTEAETERQSRASEWIEMLEPQINCAMDAMVISPAVIYVHIWG